MNATTLLREQYREAHAWLQETMRDVTPEQAHWLPPGRVNPIGAGYVHVLVGEDFIVSSLLEGRSPLLATTWAGKTGIGEMPPNGPDWGAWARRVRLDLDSLRPYGQAVQSAVDEYLAPLKDEELDREVQVFDLGKRTAAWILSDLLAHIRDHCGEISCLKGLQGAQGYPNWPLEA